MKKVCVVGAGRWGMNHIKTLHNLNALGGIVENNIKVLESLKITYPSVACFLNLSDALNDRFDGFTVATPALTHFSIAKQIIEAGKHVLIEKPITLKSDDAEILAELAIEKNVNLMVGHVLLFHPAFKKIKSLLDDGSLGDLQYMYSNRLNLGTIRTEENVFWSFAPHDIALFQYFSNSFPNKITSRGEDILQEGIHDITITTLEYPDRIMGHIFVSWLHPFKEHRFVIVGSKGMIRFEDSAEGKPLIFYNKSVDWKDDVPFPHDGPTHNIDYETAMPLTEELKYFVNHLDGSQISICHSQSAIEVMKILESATESLTGKYDG
ncbi:MAG: Gfo/Idh/MocA family oxidoreductase [Bacteroidetes bacterium]|jgi:UDP-2-acetamido-3-amino-2,3-dideoxy-glucuronate N-acetyltransferase|nr:Gfo/Idh/MocA family oxidoreductase [Bacteroidota bacterium]